MNQFSAMSIPQADKVKENEQSEKYTVGARLKTLQVSGSSGNPWNRCHNKDWTPSGSPTICPLHVNILHIEVAGVFGTLTKNVPEPWPTHWTVSPPVYSVDIAFSILGQPSLPLQVLYISKHQMGKKRKMVKCNWGQYKKSFRTSFIKAKKGTIYI